MLVIDERIGSRDMRTLFERQGIQVDLQRLDACDIGFVGRGINDEPITIGIELKRVQGGDRGRSDLIQSLRSGRLAGHQLGGMQEYNRAWLVTEGLWRGNDEGVLEIWSGGGWQPLRNGRAHVMMRDVEAQLLTLITRGGLHYWHCPTQRDTIRFVCGLYRWWTDKSLAEHRSHEVIYLPAPDRAVFVEPSTFVKMVSCLPGIGYDKALAIDAHFVGSFPALFAASPKDLRAVAGIGPTLAERIYTSLHSSAIAA